MQCAVAKGHCAEDWEVANLTPSAERAVERSWELQTGESDLHPWWVL